MSIFDCIVCLETNSNVNLCKNKCPNSCEHKMCMDCYIQLAYTCIQKNKNLCCPYCRNEIQKVNSINLFSSDFQRIFRKNITLKNGKKHGLCEIFFLSAKIMERTYYFNGKHHGKSYQYFPDGTIHGNFTYFNGKLKNKSKIYFANGQVQVICHYKNDKLHGIYKEYDENGKLIIFDNYKNGKKDGYCYQYIYQLSNNEEILYKITEKILYKDDIIQNISSY